jgi:tetratricopeptide (TPR) repeat protein
VGRYWHQILEYPNYAYAWVYLSWAHFIDGYFFYSNYDQKESFKHATKIAQKVLEIDDKLSDAYALLSMEEARAYCAKALELDPNYSVEGARKYLLYKDSEYTERILDALRKAGIPEKPPK